MTPVPVGVQRLAAQLARRMPWLARNRHIGALARVLRRHQLDTDAGWSAERLLHALEQHNRATGHLVPDPATQRNPLGYLNWLLTTAAPQLPTHRPDPTAAEGDHPVAAWRRENAERRQQITAQDPAAVAAIIAQIRADIAADRDTRSRTERPGLGG